MADQLPADDPNRLAMRIAPRTLLCGNSWRIGGTVADIGFDELRELTDAAGDKVSLAIGMLGWDDGADLQRPHPPNRAAGHREFATLVESIGDPALIVGLLPGPYRRRLQAGGKPSRRSAWRTG